jgi:gluconolactonase
MKIFTQNVGFPEAPVLLPDGNLLIVEMTPDKGCITHVTENGAKQTILARTGRPNGLARDRNGVVWIAETAQRAVMRMAPGGKPEVFAEQCKGEPFLFLNDVAIAPNGDAYFTDSGIALDEFAPNGELNPKYRELKYDGRVYRVDPKTRDVDCIDRGIQFTNGVAFGPDGNLYATETLSGNIFRYEYRDGRVVGRREIFGNVIERFDPAEIKGPDGMKFGADGHLYVAVFGQGDITVLDPRGKVARRIKVGGKYPTNVAFGPKGSKHLYVTEVETASVRIFDVGVDGFPLHT